MTDCNVLITSAGRRVSLVRMFQRALGKLHLNGLVYAVDLQNHAPALQVADRSQTMPRVTDASYIDQLLAFCIEKQIKLVVPTIDTELLVLSKARSQFLSHGIQLLTCSNKINRTFFDKRSTQRFFENNKIPTPRLFSPDEAIQLQAIQYPLLLKPNQGSCSIGVTKVNNKKELLFYLDYLEDPIIQEFIEGNEYTIDVLIDFNGDVRCAVPRLRVETRAGEVSKAITINNSDIIDWVYKISKALKGALGCINIQCIQQNNGNPKFIEINPRFGGGFPLSAEAGADFPRFIIQMILGIDVNEDLQNTWRDGCVMLRYDEGLFTTRQEVKL